MTPEQFSSLLDIVNTLTIFVTGVFVAIQVRAMQLANRASAFSIIFSTLQSEDVREARKRILDIHDKYSTWNPDTKKDAEKIGHTYDTVGILLKRGVVPYSYVIEEWHDSIIKCWGKCSDMIEEYRISRGDDFWDEFETLYNRSIKFEKRNSIYKR